MKRMNGTNERKEPTNQRSQQNHPTCASQITMPLDRIMPRHPEDDRKKPHVLSFRTADSRLFCFQAESEVKQALWLMIMKRVTTRCPAPPLTSAISATSNYQALRSYFGSLGYMERELKCYTSYVRASQELVRRRRHWRRLHKQDNNNVQEPT